MIIYDIKGDKMTNMYSQSKVYKLVDDEGYYYFGSTCAPLYKRFYNHKQDAYRDPERKIYKIFTHEKFIKGEIRIILVETFNLNYREELLKEENKYIEKHLNDPKCLNSKICIKPIGNSINAYIQLQEKFSRNAHNEKEKMLKVATEENMKIFLKFILHRDFMTLCNIKNPAE